MAAPDPGAAEELRKLACEHLDAMVLKGEIYPDYEVGEMVWDEGSESYKGSLRMNLVLPLSKPG
jgi:hypothetical protein